MNDQEWRDAQQRFRQKHLARCRRLTDAKLIKFVITKKDGERIVLK